VALTTTASLVTGFRQYMGAAGRIEAVGVQDFTRGLAIGTYTGEIDRKDGDAGAP
jgi:hypothetical protein